MGLDELEAAALLLAIAVLVGEEALGNLGVGVGSTAAQSRYVIVTR